jgi:hydroxylamine reductase (hybrid-cluster protein)
MRRPVETIVQDSPDLKSINILLKNEDEDEEFSVKLANVALTNTMSNLEEFPIAETAHTLEQDNGEISKMDLRFLLDEITGDSETYAENETYKQITESFLKSAMPINMDTEEEEAFLKKYVKQSFFEMMKRLNISQEDIEVEYQQSLLEDPTNTVHKMRILNNSIDFAYKILNLNNPTCSANKIHFLNPKLILRLIIIRMELTH